jgi:hypothetical protein
LSLSAYERKCFGNLALLGVVLRRSPICGETTCGERRHCLPSEDRRKAESTTAYAASRTSSLRKPTAACPSCCNPGSSTIG